MSSHAPLQCCSGRRWRQDCGRGLWAVSTSSRQGQSGLFHHVARCSQPWWLGGQSRELHGAVSLSLAAQPRWWHCPNWESSSAQSLGVWCCTASPQHGYREFQSHAVSPWCRYRVFQCRTASLWCRCTFVTCCGSTDCWGPSGHHSIAAAWGSTVLLHLTTHWGPAASAGSWKVACQGMGPAQGVYLGQHGHVGQPFHSSGCSEGLGRVTNTLTNSSSTQSLPHVPVFNGLIKSNISFQGFITSIELLLPLETA